MNNKYSYLFLAIIILTGLLLSYLLYSGPFYAFDDLTYIIYSHQFFTGAFNPVQSPYAYGFLLPLSLAVSFAIIGVNVFASILPSLLEYLIIIIASFAIGRKLYGDNVGLLSAFFVATAPFVVGYSTRVLPDMGVGALVSISILFLVYVNESNNKIFYFLSGAFAAMTIYVKLIGLAYILSFLIALFFYRFYDRKKTNTQKITNNILIYSFAGLVALGLIYIIIMFSFSGSLFGTFVKYGTNQMTISPSNLSNNINTFFITLFSYKSFALIPDPQVFPIGLIIFLALAGTLIGFILKRKDTIFLSLILWIAFLYVLFGTVTITRYSFIFVVSRYFIMISVPLAVLASYALINIYNSSKPLLKKNSIYLPILIMIIIFVLNLPIYNTLYNYNISISGDVRTISNTLNYIKTESNGQNIEIITTDNGTSNFIQFLSGYNKKISTYTLNTSNKVIITNQLSNICLPNASDTYLVVAYDNYSKLQYSTIFNAWINTSCSLVKLKSFTDNVSSNSAYNGTNVRIDLYKVN